MKTPHLAPTVLRLTVTLCPAVIACSGATLHERAIEHNARAATLIEEGELAGARASLEVALEYNPRFAEAHANLGLIDLREGRLEDAERRLEKAVLFNPDFAEAWTNLAGLSLSLGMPDEALVRARQAVEVDPDFPEGRIALIRALLLSGSEEEAEDQARRLMVVRPDEARSHAVIAMVALARRQLDVTDREVELALEIDGELPLALEVRGRLRLLLGRAAEAGPDLSAALRDRPADVDLRYLRALALLQGGEVERAEAELREALARRPRHARALAALALIEAAQGQRTRARELLARALEAQPGLAEAVGLCRQLGESCAAAPEAVDTSR
jgi:tetratricopeptide (TPR) repeat protein